MDTQHIYNILTLEAVPSTNTYLRELVARDPSLPNLYSVHTLEQTEGRGQRGNQWYSRPGQDLAMSLLLRSNCLNAKEQYAVSELVAYATLKTIARYLTEEQAEQLSVKWPNDIYYGERKIAGILIEHSITGSKVDYSIAGIGINLNGTDFPEDLPNPISLRMITGESYDSREVLERLLRRFGWMLEEFLMGHYAEVHRLYMKRLYRRHGLYPYHDAQGRFMASIKDVLPNGCLVLEREDGQVVEYAFKEVVFDAH